MLPDQGSYPEPQAPGILQLAHQVQSLVQRPNHYATAKSQQWKD